MFDAIDKYLLTIKTIKITNNNKDSKPASMSVTPGFIVDSEQL